MQTVHTVGNKIGPEMRTGKHSCKTRFPSISCFGAFFPPDWARALSGPFLLISSRPSGSQS